MPTKLKPWNKDDIKTLKRLIRDEVPAKKIGSSFRPRRTEGAVRQKAHAEGISFKSARRRRGALR